MSRIRRLPVPLLVAALVTMLIGPGGATAVEPRTIWGKITIPAAAFIPTTNSWDYVNSGLRLYTLSGAGNFTAPLTFPAQTVRIKKMTLYAYDNSPGQVCANLDRVSPRNANQIMLGHVCTSDSTADPQAVSTTAISPRLVNTAVQGPLLWVHIDGPGFWLYGAAVVYSYEA